ncbi:MAG: CopG family transcriptional regulator [Geobacter sp.]|nr:CopG family transcriptional regulator [Geobacter sp.]
MVQNNKPVPRKKVMRITATLAGDQYERLEELAAKNRVSVAWLIRRSVDRLIEDVDGGLKLPFED